MCAVIAVCRYRLDPKTRTRFVRTSQVLARIAYIILGRLSNPIEFLQRDPPEYVWFRQSDRALKDWLSSNGYRLDIETAESFIAVRRDLPQIQSPGPQTPGCFPAP